MSQVVWQQQQQQQLPAAASNHASDAANSNGRSRAVAASGREPLASQPARSSASFQWMRILIVDQSAPVGHSTLACWLADALDALIRPVALNWRPQKSGESIAAAASLQWRQRLNTNLSLLLFVVRWLRVVMVSCRTTGWRAGQFPATCKIALSLVAPSRSH